MKLRAPLLAAATVIAYAGEAFAETAQKPFGAPIGAQDSFVEENA
jgi:hypothetical protein